MVAETLFIIHSNYKFTRKYFILIKLDWTRNCFLNHRLKMAKNSIWNFRMSVPISSFQVYRTSRYSSELEFRMHIPSWKRIYCNYADTCKLYEINLYVSDDILQFWWVLMHPPVANECFSNILFCDEWKAISNGKETWSSQNCFKYSLWRT